MNRALFHGVAAALMSSSIAASAGEGGNNLPLRYTLAEVSLEFAKGARQEGLLVQVAGTGKGTVRETYSLRDDVTSTFTVPSKEVFALLELCYRERFFDLLDRYDPPNHLRLGADGMIDTMTTVVADAGSHAVTVRIGAYSKSVSFLPGYPPPVVTELARRIDNLRATPGGRSSNYGVNAPGRPVTPLAAASDAPVRPARYALR